MKFLDRIVVERRGGVERAVELYQGDLSALAEDEKVDLVVVSAFPNDYSPTSTSLIGALYRRGLSVKDLADAKAVDLREFSSCWLSGEIAVPGIHINRLLCFEHARRGFAAELVGDVFRSLVPFASGTMTIKDIAIPVLASGDQKEPAEVMFKALLKAALEWMLLGLTVERVKLVIYRPWEVIDLSEIFAAEKLIFGSRKIATIASSHGYDAFISYSRREKSVADHLVNQIKSLSPRVRLFVDTLELNTGSAWQQHIFESLDDCKKVVALLSPSYLTSKVCKEEYNIALFRHRDSIDGVLMPILIHAAELPTYMRLVQYIDATEADPARLATASSQIIQTLG